MPLLSPIKFKKQTKEDFTLWLHEQLIQTMSDRHELESKWENYLIQARAQQPEGELEFPFVGASNQEMPLTDIHLQPVFADFYQTLHAPEDYFSVTAKRGDRVGIANSLREALTAVEKRYLKMRRVNSRALLDLITLGTGIYKNHWHESRYTRQDYDANGKIIDKVVRKSEPRIEHVPLQKFFFPADSWDLDPNAQGGTPWQAQQFDFSPAKFREFARGSVNLPGFSKEDITEVEKWIFDEEKPVDVEIRREDKYEPFEDKKIRLFEVWARYDVNDDGIDEDVVVIFHLETMRVLRAIHNPFMHGKWPFKATKYLPWFGIYGRGLAEVDEWAQDSLTKLLNAQLDNVLLANTKMYSAPLGSNIQPGEPIYPSKIWFVGPNERVEGIQMGDIYSSMPNVISQIMQFSEMRTGVSEIRQGNLTGLPSRTPATSLLSILQEGNKRFDMILSSFRDVHSEIGMEVLQNLLQHAKEDPLRWQTFFQQALGEEDAQNVFSLFASSMTDMEESFGVAVTATSAQVNKEVEKQSFIGLMQIVSQIYGQLVQTAMLMSQAQDPLTIQTAQAAYTSGTELLKRLLERFDVQNPSEYLPNLQALQQSGALGPQGGQMQQGGLPGVGGGGLGVTGQASGIPFQGLGQGGLGALLGL